MEKAEKSDVQERNEDKKAKEEKQSSSLFDDAYNAAARVGSFIEEHPVETTIASAAVVAAAVAITRGRAARAVAPLEGAASGEAKLVAGEARAAAMAAERSIVPATESLLANSIAITAESRAIASSAAVLRLPVLQRAAAIRGATAAGLESSPTFMTPATGALAEKSIAIADQASALAGSGLNKLAKPILELPPYLKGTIR